MAGRIPHLPRFNVPETFGKALSYEGQIHAIFEKYDDQIETFNAAIPAVETALDRLDDIDATIESADTAAANANQAAGTAVAAATDATDAAAAATQAATTANNAATAATQAATTANNAATAATQAATAANNAAASAIAASGNLLTATLTGPTPQTADDAWTGPLIGATVDGLSVQDGTPTPSVPVEIRSVEGAIAKVAGKNLFEYDKTLTTNSAVMTQTDTGLRTYTTANSTYQGATFGRNDTVFVNGTTYTISADVIVTSGVARISTRRKRDHVLVNSSSNVTTSGHISLTFTYNSSTPVYVMFFCTLGTSEAGDVTYSNIQIEAASTESTYETPHGVSNTSLLPSTAAPLRSLPDGTHDELTVGRDGSVTVIRRVGAFAMNSVTWNMSSNVGLFYSARTDMPGSDSSLVPMCEVYAHHAAVTNAGGANTALASGEIAISYAASQPYIYVKDTDYSTAAAFNAATTDALVFYPLATPTTETLPSVTMPTVPSTNLTAWVDATDANGAAMAAGWTATYERDITVVIDQLEQAIADL